MIDFKTRLVLELADRCRHILRDVDQHRAGTARISNAERVAQYIGELLHMPDHEIMLGDGHGNARDINLLERVFANQRRADIAGNRNHRDRIHIGSGNAGNQVGRTRPGCRNDNAGLPCCACIAVGCVGRALLMRGQHMADAVAVQVQRVINVQNRAARIAKDRVDALLDQDFDQDL